MLTSAGRRGYLVSYFQEALDGRGNVFAADADPNAAALQVADQAFVVPRFSEPGYCDYLRELCVRHEVNLVISLNDLELPLLARERKAFAEYGIEVLVSEPDVMDTCLDKWQTFLMLVDAGIDTPLTYVSLEDARSALSEGVISFPVIVKPRWGTGSIGIEVARSNDELNWAYQLISSKLNHTILADISKRDIGRTVIIQEAVTGSEYGLDIINDLTGRYVTTFVKKKLSMRAGETDKAVTVKDAALEVLGQNVGQLTSHVALLDCDVLVDEDGRIAVLELNPRFGGGYPFSHVAGANIPAAILAWLEDQTPNPEWLTVREGVTAAKYDLLAVVKKPNH